MPSSDSEPVALDSIVAAYGRYCLEKVVKSKIEEFIGGVNGTPSCKTSR